ncbi:MAG TPA: hypothetical protein VG889_02250 [Rhizomicrobium sp.]|nr:hypothetical protein [Rhizomicrobium sp.]
MNAKDLLNMDMETAVQWLLHFWRWWTTELLGLLPHEWQERLSKRSRVVAELRGGQLVYRNAENGQPYAVKPRGAITFLMPAGSVLVREVELPLLPMSDVKRMLALDIDRLTPFQTEQVYFDADVLERDQENGRQKVAVGVLPREQAEKVLADVQARDLTPAVLGVRGDAAFDFLAAMRDAQGGDAAQKRAAYLWIGAAAMLAFNLIILTWHDSSSLDELRQAVDSQQASVSVALRTRERVDHEAAQRAQLMDTKMKSAPLPVLDAVTAAMPLDAWVRRFEWNGRSVHITGARKTSQDILARLEASPVLRNARSQNNDNHADTAGNIAFEFTADREPANGRAGGTK